MRLLIAFCLLLPYPAFAYIGPGAGLSAFGALFALIAMIGVTLFGFIWYPLKRILKKKKSQSKTEKNK